MNKLPIYSVEFIDTKTINELVNDYVVTQRNRDELFGVATKYAHDYSIDKKDGTVTIDYDNP